MRVAMGSDHAGLELKRVLADHLRAAGHEVRDLGTEDGRSCDYPDFAKAVCHAVLDGSAERGVLVCGTGQGMAMTANKVSGIRAAVVADTFSARMAMMHNDARVLCLGQRVVGAGLAADIVDAWVSATFEGGRHANRVAKMEP
ncbi:MAG: ribose 5-phosphate isomerase B [Alphaproteobacteria bacterium]|nr:ribose 5-phosphate isomerase B [Alphaproteobacteria bacterium]MCB9696345.1 ribose 5-phosphate isomerase B [Alphaproteobacteria bacterium]